MGEWRPAPFGCSADVARICWRRSIEAFRRTQFSPSTVSATPTCVRGLTRGSPLQASWQTRQPQFHCGTPPPAPAPRTSALSRALVGDIVEARRDMGRAARGRGKPASLHQGTRGRVEIAIARGTGDRKRAYRAGRADRERDAHDSLRAAGASRGRIEEAATNGGTHLPYIGGHRGSARRRARGRARRGSAARRLGRSRPRLRLSRSGRRLGRRFRLGFRRLDAGRRRFWRELRPALEGAAEAAQARLEPEAAEASPAEAAGAVPRWAEEQAAARRRLRRGGGSGVGSGAAPRAAGAARQRPEAEAFRAGAAEVARPGGGCSATGGTIGARGGGAGGAGAAS